MLECTKPVEIYKLTVQAQALVDRLNHQYFVASAQQDVKAHNKLENLIIKAIARYSRRYQKYIDNPTLTA